MPPLKAGAFCYARLIQWQRDSLDNWWRRPFSGQRLYPGAVRPHDSRLGVGIVADVAAKRNRGLVVRRHLPADGAAVKVVAAVYSSRSARTDLF